MKKKIDHRSQLPLADMHADGVRFDPNILMALKKQQAGQREGDQQTSL
ncbi:hypothetical protein ACT6NV_12180 [Robiginitalea sp. IMCC44478]